ncbi:orotidine 5'-phosphate decarboxylase [Oxobacter pfennigii]|uniref:Orotidine 5'-phosphate decarboxylase n=1 Tax=Oxobacter pfennigii TaxID=36849 RepID=A0A0P8YY10_9CLOT|nr:orotidine-5'-phosphate decarboxylase [Oxobacter pfennigii]KPU44645.1 orotidine 5'-phosphate decarboxylase [Oxobacter pfennigii]
MFIDRLIDGVLKVNNPVVVGLDTRIEHVPEGLRSGVNDAQDIFKYNREILDAVKGLVTAIKIQSACYEALGVEGVSVYKQTIDYARDMGLLVIGDVKRGDIGSTAEEYGKAHFSAFGCDAITVNPYMGMDTIEPFIKCCLDLDKGLFVLIKTSNPGSNDFQNLDVGGKKLYEVVAQKVFEESEKYKGEKGYSFIGGVLGATYPDELQNAREILKSSFLLIPGYGAQGGKAEDIALGFTKGIGALINASRSVLTSHKNEEYRRIYGDDYASCIKHEVTRMRDELLSHIKA